jgi:hypothetical protein
MKHTEINGCTSTANCCHLICVWNQHRPRPFSCRRVILPERIFTVMAFKDMYDCEILVSEIEKHPAFYDCSIREYSDKFQRQTVGRSVRGSRSWVEPTGRPGETRKSNQCCFSMYLIKMHKFTLICCKIQRCLTLQRKQTLAESYNFLVVVNKGQYFSRVCQIPNYTLSYCQGTAPCGNVKYLAKQSLTCFPLMSPLVPVAWMLLKLLSYKLSSTWNPSFQRTKLCNMQQSFAMLSQNWGVTSNSLWKILHLFARIPNAHSTIWWAIVNL